MKYRCLFILYSIAEENNKSENFVSKKFVIPKKTEQFPLFMIYKQFSNKYINDSLLTFIIILLVFTSQMDINVSTIHSSVHKILRQ